MRKRVRRYAKWWFPTAKEAIREYPYFQEGNSEQENIWIRAIRTTLDETRQLPDGDLRIKVIDLLYFKQSHDIDGAALKVNSCRRTVQRWTSTFIYAVGRAAGYE